MGQGRLTVASSDEALIQACRAGNQAAWQLLVEKYQRLVYSVPIKYRLSPEDAADVFQGVWVDLYRDLDRLEQPNAVRGWLITAASRRCLLLKKRWLPTGSEPSETIPDLRRDAEQIRLEAERDQLLRDALHQLTERCRQMIQMLFFDSPPRPYADVARELGLAEGSIGFIRGRCLKKLRQLMELHR